MPVGVYGSAVACVDEELREVAEHRLARVVDLDDAAPGIDRERAQLVEQPLGRLSRPTRNSPPRVEPGSTRSG